LNPTNSTTAGHQSRQIPLFSETGKTDRESAGQEPDRPTGSGEEVPGGAPSVRRVYPLDNRDLSEEQIAVAFAMTSRRPEPFDEIAREISEEKAADFHERWVLGYGHASVAEHAVIHMAVENISRLACDALEDNRLASYTEKSSRYQVMDAGFFHVPSELDAHPALRREYVETCRHLFDVYQQLIDACMEHLRGEHPQRPPESEAAYGLRLRRIATDGCRSVLPASTLTNVGVTANARTLEHAISKLMSSELAEERELGGEVREQGRSITPTLIKYADTVDYLSHRPRIRQELSDRMGQSGESPESLAVVRLVHWDGQAEEKLAAAFLYGSTGLQYSDAWERSLAMGPEGRCRLIDSFLEGRGPHDAPPRELEVVDYTFEILLDYGAFREFRRHRMQTYLPQLLTVTHGVRIPSVIADAGLEGPFSEATVAAEGLYRRILDEVSPAVAQYAVTHAHYRRVLSKLNLRECYHLFKLRTSKEAHESIRDPMKEALRHVESKHPQLFRHLQLRG